MFLNEMERVVPWQELLALIAPHAPLKATDLKPFPIEAMLRVYFLQWFGLNFLANISSRGLSRRWACTKKPGRITDTAWLHHLKQVLLLRPDGVRGAQDEGLDLLDVVRRELAGEVRHAPVLERSVEDDLV